MGTKAHDGLSPLARGTQQLPRSPAICARFIPAGAGNTVVAGLAQIFEAVYPRWRGEHGRKSPVRWLAAGLSPLARGTHSAQRCDGRRHRFIPAGAGNTSTESRNTRHANGLSPLARGTRRHHAGSNKRRRFIPAGAGNTVAHPILQPENSVYPRWRGEHAGHIPQRGQLNGLSPLARGTPRVRTVTLPRWRFIPAGAGNTNPQKRGRRQCPVYPRWRGEHAQLKLLTGTIIRFIPAGAGNTEPWYDTTLGIPVYPRWRGEHTSEMLFIPSIIGLSPLARGTPADADALNGFNRFIPAGAGNTQAGAWAEACEPVYPRWRGEHDNCRVTHGNLTGLSPLARGTLFGSPCARS